MRLVRRLGRIATAPVSLIMRFMAEPALLVLWVLMTVAVVHFAAGAAAWLFPG